MDWGNTLLLILSLLIAAIVIAGMVWYTQFMRPRTNAFKFGQPRVSIWFRQGELILWNPGQTFAFLRNKQLTHVGDAKGGMKAIYPFRGEEAVGPIQLQSALFGWEDSSVLTRDGQILSIKVGVWWKVADAEKYVFHIYSDPATDSLDGNTYAAVPSATRLPGSPGMRSNTFNQSTNAKFDTSSMHRVADQWLRVITESTVRAQINNLAVSDVVSAQAMQFLRHASQGTVIDDAATVTGTFEAAILTVLGDIQRKALEFGVQVERLEVQHVQLPVAIQDAINETRIAFLAPIKGEREAEAVRIKLEKLVSVLGRDTVGLNEIMKNFQHANFMTPMNFMQPLMDNISRKAESLPKDDKLLTDS